MWKTIRPARLEGEHIAPLAQQEFHSSDLLRSKCGVSENALAGEQARDLSDPLGRIVIARKLSLKKI